MLEQQKVVGMSLDDFMAKYEEQPFELIDGEIIPMGPLKRTHAEITKMFYDKLFLWTHVNSGLGRVYQEVPFVLEDKSDWVRGSRIPDVMLYRQERLDKHDEIIEGFADKPFILVPDIVVEVISPTDSYSDVERKAELYLEDSVKIIWVIDPQRKAVKEYTPQNPDGISKRNDDVLSGGDVAKGFELKVNEIFEYGRF